jgi:hypothetical protein
MELGLHDALFWKIQKLHFEDLKYRGKAYM